MQHPMLAPTVWIGAASCPLRGAQGAASSATANVAGERGGGGTTAAAPARVPAAALTSGATRVERRTGRDA